MFQRVLNQRWRMLNWKTKMSSHNRNCAVGESCTIFNQRFYSYFLSFSLFYIPLIVKMDSSSIKVHALLDSGASTCFMNKDFVNLHRLLLVIKKTSYPRISY
jgi:hypothetical protein